MDNTTDQLEEIEALTSIYEDQLKPGPEANSFSIDVTPEVTLYFILNERYPSEAPPKYELLAPSLNSEQKQLIIKDFQEIYESNCGGPVLFQWIERLKEIADFGSSQLSEDSIEKEGEEEIVSPENKDKLDFSLKVTHGEVITDRKSVFQAHVAQVTSKEETGLFLEYLLENKRIAQATHNISAYRITTATKNILEDCDDDGEHQAGGRLLHLLKILDIKDVMVVVTRWYGGIHLGPDRFKHINNAARQVLVQAEILNS